METYKESMNWSIIKDLFMQTVWQMPYILKINPENGEVVGKIDFSELYKKHAKGQDDVLNGICF